VATDNIMAVVAGFRPLARLHHPREVIRQFTPREPLNNSPVVLRALQRAVARRGAPAMASPLPSDATRLMHAAAPALRGFPGGTCSALRLLDVARYAFEVAP